MKLSTIFWISLLLIPIGMIISYSVPLIGINKILYFFKTYWSNILFIWMIISVASHIFYMDELEDFYPSLTKFELKSYKILYFVNIFFILYIIVVYIFKLISIISPYIKKFNKFLDNLEYTKI